MDTPRKVKEEAGTPCYSARAANVGAVMEAGSRALPPPPPPSPPSWRRWRRVEEMRVAREAELAVAEVAVQGVGLHSARTCMYTTTV